MTIISKLYFSPVKSLSFQPVNKCRIIKDIGIKFDREIAFTRNADFKFAKELENNSYVRNHKDFLSLKNTISLNKYSFYREENKLTLYLKDEKIIEISLDNKSENILLCKKLAEIEKKISSPTYLLQNREFPFFDTSSSKNIFNSVSLINLNSIRDFEIKINEKVELQRFRANFYVDGIDAWEERNWLGKIIKINNVSFKVEKNIPRCVAINLKPKTDDNSLNLLTSLKKTYNHFDMGIYLTALNDGKVEIENKIKI